MGPRKASSSFSYLGVHDANSLADTKSKQLDNNGPEKVEKISTTYALINLLKGMVGPGCFALPLSFKQAGLWAGMAVVFLLGIASSICMIKLVECSQYLCKRNNKRTLDYGQMAEEAFRSSFAPLRKFAFTMKIIVNSCLILLQIGICSVFYIFVVDHLTDIQLHIWPHLHISRNLYFLIVLPAFLILCTIRTLKVISYVCLMGNILMACSLTIILEELIRAPHINTRDLPAITDMNGVTLAAGSILYALEGQALVLPLENKMKYPQDMKGYTGVLSTGVSLVSLIYAACGFYGYITYGCEVKASITLNLTDKPLDFSVKIMLLIVVFFAFLIQSFPLVEMIWPPIKKRLREKNYSRTARIASEYLFRYSIVFVALGISFAVPNLDEIIPLVGVTAGMMLALVLPPIMETACFLPVWIEEGATWKMYIRLALNLLYFLMGLFFVVTGLQANISTLASHTSDKSCQSNMSF
ncbi:unnamed protein product [Auanema sp. JU1783]|nr:unnamed protein product [Auanema sp. JU1783]